MMDESVDESVEEPMGDPVTVYKLPDDIASQIRIWTNPRTGHSMGPDEYCTQIESVMMNGRFVKIWAKEPEEKQKGVRIEITIQNSVIPRLLDALIGIASGRIIGGRVYLGRLE